MSASYGIEGCLLGCFLVFVIPDVRRNAGRKKGGRLTFVWGGTGLKLDMWGGDGSGKEIVLAKIVFGVVGSRVGGDEGFCWGSSSIESPGRASACSGREAKWNCPRTSSNDVHNDLIGRKRRGGTLTEGKEVGPRHYSVKRRMWSIKARGGG